MWTEGKLYHIAGVSKHFDRFLEASVRVNISKCNFGVQEVTALGHKVKRNCIAMSDENVDTMREWQEPVNGDALCRYIGVENYFRALVLDLATRMFPLDAALQGQLGTDSNARDSPLLLRSGMIAAVLGKSQHSKV